MSRDEAFRQMALGQSAALRRLAYAVCGDWHRTDDLVQGTLERAYAHWPRVEAADDTGAYLRTMLLNLAVTEQRRPWRWRERSSAVPAPPRPDPAADAALATALDRLDLARALAGLTAKQRAVVVLHHLEDRPVREVAAILGVSEGTVKRQLHDAVAHLARLLAPAAADRGCTPASVTEPTVEVRRA